jgi:hypothetical protein
MPVRILFIKGNRNVVDWRRFAYLQRVSKAVVLMNDRYYFFSVARRSHCHDRKHDTN